LLSTFGTLCVSKIFSHPQFTFSAFAITVGNMIVSSRYQVAAITHVGSGLAEAAKVFGTLPAHPASENSSSETNTRDGRDRVASRAINIFEIVFAS
jgi:hypothetical protein